MPTISTFYGIVISIYHREHGVPHFHASYGGFTASIAIDDASVLAGWLPPRALRLAIDWAQLHQGELLLNWERARAHEDLVPIAPMP